jgi:hypothetical protein
VLSPLQERIARIIAGLGEAEDFALAGGGALKVRGDIDRKTRDLDFFGLSAAAVDRLVPAAEQVLRDPACRSSGCRKVLVLRALSSRTRTIGPRWIWLATPDSFQRIKVQAFRSCPQKS